MASIIRKTLGSYSILLRRLKSKTAALIGRGDDFNTRSVGRRLKRNAGVVVNGCLASGLLRSRDRQTAVECARAYPKCVAFWNKVLDDEKATIAERMMASDRLMDRAFGKAPQPVRGALDQRTRGSWRLGDVALCGAAQRAPVRIGFLCADRVVVDQYEVER
jgi:hypothetical protein